MKKKQVSISEYLSAGNLVNKWNLLNEKQKKDAYNLKKAFGWKTTICIQKVLFFGWTVEKQRRFFETTGIG